MKLHTLATETFKRLIPGVCRPPGLAMMLATGALLAACGGGGNEAGSQPTPAPPQQPAPATVINPLSGVAAPGEAVNVIHGTSVSGAMVTAYSMQADGSNGAALGPAVPTDADGAFTLALSARAGNWIRIVSRGGKYLRIVDYTFHPIESMELVTPYATTRLDYFVLSPVSDAGARIMAHHARAGEPLADAFRKGMRSVLRLDLANMVFDSDDTVFLNMLKGSIASDLGYHKAQTLNQMDIQVGIDRLGILLDLPSAEAWRVLAAAGERDFGPGALDGNGQPVTVGTWVDGDFSTTQRTSLQQLLNTMVMEDMKVTDPATGAKVAPSIRELVSRYLLLDFWIDHYCETRVNGTLLDRYPFYLDGATIATPETCVAVRRRIGYFQTRLQNNRTGTWKSPGP